MILVSKLRVSVVNSYLVDISVLRGKNSFLFFSRPRIVIYRQG